MPPHSTCFCGACLKCKNREKQKRHRSGIVQLYKKLGLPVPARTAPPETLRKLVRERNGIVTTATSPLVDHFRPWP